MILSPVIFFLISFFFTLVFILYLVYEKRQIHQWILSVPLRIAVSGTRGKSGSVYMLSEILRLQGKRVLGKVTGSETSFIYPDGTIVPIKRKGLTSIIEQKKVIATAARLKVDCLVVEIMSIQAENHIIEAHHLIQPHIILFTNIRSDHWQGMGEDKTGTSRVLSLDVTRESTVFIHPQDCLPDIESAVQKMNARLVKVDGIGKTSGINSVTAFPENLALIKALSEYLGLDKDVVDQIGKKKIHYPGIFEVFQYLPQDFVEPVFFVNAFAVNDPESFYQLIENIKPMIFIDTIVGILVLRSDRPDRSAQWLKTLIKNKAYPFQKLFVYGRQAMVFQHRLKQAVKLTITEPEMITRSVIDPISYRTLVIGFGNFKGLGEQLANFWREKGERYGV